MSIYPILYNNHLLIQTPVLYVPFGVHYFKLDVSLESDTFTDFIKKFMVKLPKSYKIISSIKPKLGDYPERIRFSKKMKLLCLIIRSKK